MKFKIITYHNNIENTYYSIIKTPYLFLDIFLIKIEIENKLILKIDIKNINRL